jgi:protoporphyrinogen oxidase
MWEKCADLIEQQGGSVQTRKWVGKVYREGQRVTGVDIHSDDGSVERVQGDEFINTMALRDLIHAFDPPPPPEVIEAADALKYRDFLIVTLVLNRADPFPDNWIYVHSPQVKVGRIQNFRAWSAAMLPNPDTASIGMEYFCQEGDGLWMMSDEDLRALASRELSELGLASVDEVIDAAIIRQPKAYPVYDDKYKDALDVIAKWIDSLENFQTVGRNGLHRYNNQDHSMLSAMFAARNILGEQHDVWNVNVERSYHEEFQVPKKGADGTGKGHLQPVPASGARRSVSKDNPAEHVA